MKTTIIAAAIVLLTTPISYADTFGSDPNTTFEIEFALTRIGVLAFGKGEV